MWRPAGHNAPTLVFHDSNSTVLLKAIATQVHTLPKQATTLHGTLSVRQTTVNPSDADSVWNRQHFPKQVIDIVGAERSPSKVPYTETVLCAYMCQTTKISSATNAQ